MSGPVETQDVAPTIAPGTGATEPPTVEVTASRETEVGGLTVRRALPRRGRRTVGAWCFVDHLGPASVTPARPIEVGPHPHIGLHTVTWLLSGEQLHRDSLGSEQALRPGQLNLMTAGEGVAHAEESLDYRGPMHGVQLWVAQPEATRHRSSSFAHHPELPRVDVDETEVTVLIGGYDGASSPAQADSAIVGYDLAARAGASTFALDPAYEHALVVLEGALAVDTGTVVAPGALAYLGVGRSELRLDAREPARALLLGGAPFEAPVLMWWNFVARSREEIDTAYAAWRDRDERFGDVVADAARVDAPVPPWWTGTTQPAG